MMFFPILKGEFFVAALAMRFSALQIVFRLFSYFLQENNL